METLLIKTPGGMLAPLDDEQAEHLKKIKAGSVVRSNIVRMRNGKFFRKFFVLVRFAFDVWTETVPAQEYRGRLVQPEINRFRRDLTILAGFFRPVFAIDGTMRLEAESIAWSEMDEERFEKLYSATINVVLSKILDANRMTASELRAHIDRLMEFDT